jgi:hypothetical protein
MPEATKYYYADFSKSLNETNCTHLQRKYTNSKKFEHFFNKILKVLF